MTSEKMSKELDEMK